MVQITTIFGTIYSPNAKRVATQLLGIYHPLGHATIYGDALTIYEVALRIA